MVKRVKIMKSKIKLVGGLLTGLVSVAMGLSFVITPVVNNTNQLVLKDVYNEKNDGKVIKKADVLTTKRLVTPAKVQINADGTSIRFVAGIDSLNYQRAVFNITASDGMNSQTVTKEITTAYRAIEADGNAVEATSVFGVNYNYLLAYAIHDIPSAYVTLAYQVSIDLFVVEQVEPVVSSAVREEIRVSDIQDNKIVNVFTVNAGQSIQDTIDQVSDGATIKIKNGIYNEQLNINKNLTIIGESQEGVIIAGPSDYATLETINKLTFDGLNVKGYQGLINIDGGSTGVNVSISDLTIKGNIEEATIDGIDARLVYDYLYTGISAISATVNLDNAKIKDITYNNHLKGMQNGMGIYAISAVADQTISVTNSTIENYNKCSLVSRASIKYLNFNNNNIIGFGSQNLIAQNGIQFSGPATIIGNSISQLNYTKSDSYSVGIYLVGVNYDACIIKDNSFSNVDSNIKDPLGIKSFITYTVNVDDDLQSVIDNDINNGKGDSVIILANDSEGRMHNVDKTLVIPKLVDEDGNSVKLTITCEPGAIMSGKILIHEDANDVVIDGINYYYNGSDYEWDTYNNISTASPIRPYGRNVTIRNSTFDVNTGSFNYGYGIIHTAHPMNENVLTIDNNTFTSSIWVIFGAEINGVNITNNSFKNCSTNAYGIQAINSECIVDTLIKGNKFYDRNILLGGGTTLITENQFIACTGFAYLFYKNFTGEITNNVYDCYGIFYQYYNVTTIPASIS